MKRQSVYRLNWAMATTFLVVMILVGCAGPPAPTLPPESPATSGPAVTQEPAATLESPPTSEPTSPGSDVTEPAPTTPPQGNVKYQDDFSNQATNWDAATLGDYHVGYHEPEWYEIEVKSPNSEVPIVPVPDRGVYDDVTIELEVNTFSTKTATEGDFRYGLVFRRSGDLWYGFFISQPTKTWYVVKKAPAGQQVLAEGVDESIHERDVNDLLRVDAQGSSFVFYLNDTLVYEMTDAEYASGEVGFYVKSLDNPQTHIHFDKLTIRDVDISAENELVVKYQDDFTNQVTEWNAATLGDYHVGYHEPEWYEIEVKSPNSKVPIVPVPNREVHGDATIELAVNTFSTKTATEGDFRYGVVFRRSGDLWYGFIISQPTKTWYVIKNTAAGQQILDEGADESIHERDVNDLLRVDAQGSSFVFHLNDTLVSTVTDADYASGEVGFYVESLDSPQTHIHFDKLTIAELNLSLTCTINEGGTVNVRTGPGTAFPSFAVLESGDAVEAKGKSPNLWVQVVVEGSAEPGWVSYSDGYMTCTPGIDLFPIVSE